MKSPKILFLDIETSPLEVYCWGLWDQNIALNQIKQDWTILSWAAKWLDDAPNKIMYQDQRHAKNIRDDKKLLKRIWELLDECDIVVTQNGRSFDEKKLNARFIQNGYTSPKPFKHIDTKLLAKKRFAFTSNKLEYMTDKLNTKYKKLKHNKFSGFTLWTECLAGNKEAWKEMEKYNKYDVLSLQELFEKLAPWDNSYDPNVYSQDLSIVCTCGSERFKKHGFRYNASGKYQSYTCLDCGRHSSSKMNLLTKEKKLSLKK